MGIKEEEAGAALIISVRKKMALTKNLKFGEALPEFSAEEVGVMDKDTVFQLLAERGLPRYGTDLTELKARLTNWSPSDTPYSSSDSSSDSSEDSSEGRWM